MAKKSASQVRRAAETTQAISGGPVRVDAKVQTGSRQWRRLSETHPTLKSGYHSLAEGGFQVGTITTPSGVQVQASRPKGGASSGYGANFRARAPEFGDTNYPSVRSNVAGAGRGEARWRVSRPRSANLASAIAEQAMQLRTEANPVTSHPTVGRIMSLVNPPDNAAEEHANRLEARTSRQEAMNLENTPTERAGAQTGMRAAATTAQRQRSERQTAQQQVATAVTHAAQRDPKLYEAVMTQFGRQQRAQRLETRAKNLASPESQEHLKWAGVPRTGAPGGEHNPASVPVGSTRQHTTRAREMQGYIHTQQVAENLPQNPDYREAQAWVRETGGQGPVGAAGRRITANMRRENRAKMDLAAMEGRVKPMSETVGRQPPDVIEARPMGERTNNAPAPRPQVTGTTISNPNPPPGANQPKTTTPNYQTSSRPAPRPTGGGTTESALSGARAEVAKKAGQ